MKIAEAIAAADALKPNQYTEAQKIAWLSQLDGGVFQEIICTHADPAITTFNGYAADVDRATELLVPFPYAADLYNGYLQSMIDFANGEIGKYNQSAALYTSAYQAYAAFYNRTHMPVSAGTHFIF